MSAGSSDGCPLVCHSNSNISLSVQKCINTVVIPISVQVMYCSCAKQFIYGFWSITTVVLWEVSAFLLPLHEAIQYVDVRDGLYSFGGKKGAKMWVADKVRKWEIKSGVSLSADAQSAGVTQNSRLNHRRCQNEAPFVPHTFWPPALSEESATSLL